MFIPHERGRRRAESDHHRLPCGRIAALLALAALLTLPGCRTRGAGEHCVGEGGGGVESKPCKTVCLSIWTFECKDGTKVKPKMCAGELHCIEGECPDGQVCVRLNFDRSACVPADICPEWATEGVPNPVTERDEDIKRRFREKLERRKKNLTPTAPAEPLGPADDAD